MLLRDLVPAIQLSVSPVIVISGVGLVLLSMTNRYGRVIDKARNLLDEINHVEERDKGHILSQIRIMYGRCRSLRLAIFLSSLSILLMAVLIGLLFVCSLLHFELALPLVLLFVGSMGALSASLVSFLLDINSSLRALAIEVKEHTERSPDS